MNGRSKAAEAAMYGLLHRLSEARLLAWLVTPCDIEEANRLARLSWIDASPARGANGVANADAPVLVKAILQKGIAALRRDVVGCCESPGLDVLIQRRGAAGRSPVTAERRRSAGASFDQLVAA